MALTNWRRHVHRVGRDLGVPSGARVPLAAALAGLAAVGLYLRRNQYKAGDLAVLVFPGNPSGGQPPMRLNVRVLEDASLLVGSFGIDGGVKVGPADPASQAGFAILFPGTTPGAVATSALVTASSLAPWANASSKTPRTTPSPPSPRSSPPSISGRPFVPLAPGPLNFSVPTPARRFTNMVLP